MIGGTVSEEFTVSEAQVLEEIGLSASAYALGSTGICEWFMVGDVVPCIPTNETFVSFADDVCFAPSVAVQ